MGTRGSIGFKLQGKTYETYNHFDSYPSGVGLTILEEARGIKDWDKVKGFVEKLTLVDDQEQPSKEIIDKYNEHKNTGVGEISTNKEVHTWYQLLREVQGTLKPFMDGTVEHMVDSKGFIKDDLFCEWAYIINLDTMKLEVKNGCPDTEFNLLSLPTKEKFLKLEEREEE